MLQKIIAPEIGCTINGNNKSNPLSAKNGGKNDGYAAGTDTNTDNAIATSSLTNLPGTSTNIQKLLVSTMYFADGNGIKVMIADALNTSTNIWQLANVCKLILILSYYSCLLYNYKSIIFPWLVYYSLFNYRTYIKQRYSFPVHLEDLTLYRSPYPIMSAIHIAHDSCHPLIQTLCHLVCFTQLNRKLFEDKHLWFQSKH